MTLPTHKVQAITILDAAGMPHKDIAKAVGVEPKTVKAYVDIDYMAEQRRRRKAALLNRQLIDRELDEQKRAEIKRELSVLLQRKEAAAPSITSEGHEKVSKLVCQSALKFDPLSASNIDPLGGEQARRCVALT